VNLVPIDFAKYRSLEKINKILNYFLSTSWINHSFSKD